MTNDKELIGKEIQRLTLPISINLKLNDFWRTVFDGHVALRFKTSTSIRRATHCIPWFSVRRVNVASRMFQFELYKGGDHLENVVLEKPQKTGKIRLEVVISLVFVRAPAGSTFITT